MRTGQEAGSAGAYHYLDLSSVVPPPTLSPFVNSLMQSFQYKFTQG